MNDTYCPLAFTQIFVTPNGVKPCCEFQNSRGDTIDEYLANERMEGLRERMLAGEKSKPCRACYSAEDKGLESLRTKTLQEHSDNPTEVNITHIDYRMSNLCNLKCRSCEPAYSSRIQNEVKNYPIEILNIDKRLTEYGLDDKVFKLSEADKDRFAEMIPTLKRISFTGGEPTMQKGIKELIELIPRTTEIQMTSNLNFTDQYWIDITKEFKNFHWTFSIDAIGDEAKIIRHGTKWELVDKNAHALCEVGNSIAVNTVLTNMNMASINKVIYYVADLSEQYRHMRSGIDHFFHICTHPAHLSPFNMPDEYKQKLVAESLLSADIKRAIATSTFNEDDWNNFIKYHTYLNRLRGETFEVCGIK